MRFQEIDGVVRENKGENFSVVVKPRYQGDTDKIGDNLNLSRNFEKIDTVVDPKRKRIEMGHDQLGSGPILMQTDGLRDEELMQAIEDVEPKNLYGAGPGLQARRGL